MPRAGPRYFRTQRPQSRGPLCPRTPLFRFKNRPPPARSFYNSCMGGSLGRTRDGAGTREGGAAPGLRRARHRGRAGLPAAGVAQESHVNRNEAASSRIANAMRGPRHARSASESVRKRPPRPLSHVARPRGRVEAARTRRRRRRCRLRFAPPAKVLQEPHIIKMKNKQKITFYERKKWKQITKPADQGHPARFVHLRHGGVAELSRTALRGGRGGSRASVAGRDSRPASDSRR